MDFISREDYCEENCGKENRNGYKTCKNCGMLNIPSADVQPVKHGRWIGINEYCKKNGYIPSGLGVYYWCSECENAETKISDYCPNCGATMDLKEGKKNATTFNP